MFGAGVDKKMGNMDVNCAEALAIRSGMKFARTCGSSKIIVENVHNIVIKQFFSPGLESCY